MLIVLIVSVMFGGAVYMGIALVEYLNKISSEEEKNERLR